ncbi:hypothetical protein ACROYT_G014075 [Oculina patagonica]
MGRLPSSELEAALIFDGMALLQSLMSAGCTTFGDLAQKQRAKKIVQELMLYLTGTSKSGDKIVTDLSTHSQTAQTQQTAPEAAEVESQADSKQIQARKRLSNLELATLDMVFISSNRKPEKTVIERTAKALKLHVDEDQRTWKCNDKTDVRSGEFARSGTDRQKTTEGTLEKFYLKTTSKEAILQQASSSSFGVFVGDPKKINSMSNIFIDFYNGASKATIERSRETINSGLMLTSSSTVSVTASCDGQLSTSEGCIPIDPDSSDDGFDGAPPDHPSPLYFVYDCEGTGGSVYKDHILEDAAVLQTLPDNVRVTQPTHFHSLIYTSRRIAAPEGCIPIDPDSSDDGFDGAPPDHPSPLYFVYDCEGTGGSVYKDHILEDAGVLQTLPDNVRVTANTFPFLDLYIQKNSSSSFLDWCLGHSGSLPGIFLPWRPSGHVTTHSADGVAFLCCGKCCIQNSRFSRYDNCKQIESTVAQKVAAEEELERLERSLEEKTVQIQQQEEKVNQLNEQYNKFKSLLEQKHSPDHGSVIIKKSILLISELINGRNLEELLFADAHNNETFTIQTFEKHVEARQYSTMVSPTAHRGLRQFHAGDPVLARNYGKGEKWMPGVITEVLGSRHYMVEVSGKLWKRHVDQLLSRAVSDHSNSPSSIDDYSMPLQLASPVDVSDEVVPLPSGSHTATADESQLTSTSERSESPLPGASCSVIDNDNVTVVPPILLSGIPDTSSMLEKPSYSDKVATPPCLERCYPVRVNRGLPSHLRGYELKC